MTATNPKRSFFIPEHASLIKQTVVKNWNHKLKANDEEGREFAGHLGYAILNCATLESMTYSYAAALESSHFFGTHLGGRPFSQRVRRVQDLLAEADVPVELRQRALELWLQAKTIMETRNVIAHNPISRVRIDRAEGDQATLLAVVDMTESTPSNMQSLDVSKIGHLANWAAEVAHELADCLDKIHQ